MKGKEKEIPHRNWLCAYQKKTGKGGWQMTDPSYIFLCNGQALVVHQIKHIHMCLTSLPLTKCTHSKEKYKTTFCVFTFPVGSLKAKKEHRKLRNHTQNIHALCTGWRQCRNQLKIFKEKFMWPNAVTGENESPDQDINPEAHWVGVSDSSKLLSLP